MPEYLLAIFLSVAVLGALWILLPEKHVVTDSSLDTDNRLPLPDIAKPGDIFIRPINQGYVFTGGKWVALYMFTEEELAALADKYQSELINIKQR